MCSLVTEYLNVTRHRKGYAEEVVLFPRTLLERSIVVRTVRLPDRFQNCAWPYSVSTLGCACSLPQGSEFGGDGFTDYQDSVVSERQKVRA